MRQTFFCLVVLFFLVSCQEQQQEQQQVATLAQYKAGAVLIGSFVEDRPFSEHKANANNRLNGIPHDLAHMTTYLRSIGAKIFKKIEKMGKITQFTKIRRELNNLFEQQLLLNIVYYTGHALENGTIVLDSGEQFDYTDVIDMWDARWHKSPYQVLFIILDCCYSGTWADAVKNMNRTDIIVQASCRADETSVDHPFGAIFTRHYARALIVKRSARSSWWKRLILIALDKWYTIWNHPGFTPTTSVHLRPGKRSTMISVGDFKIVVTNSWNPLLLRHEDWWWLYEE